MLLEMNFEGRSTFKRKWKLSGPLALKYEQNLRKENICFASLHRRVSGFNFLSMCEMHLSSVYCYQSLVTFLTYIF